MPTKRKVMLIVACLGAAAACTATLPDLGDRLFFQTCFAIVALILFGVGLYFLTVDYPICKERMRVAWKLCYRCMGFNLGMLFAAALYLGVFRALVVPNVTPKPYIVTLMIALAFVLSLPTMYHGFLRRYKGTDPIPQSLIPQTLIGSGILVGVAVLFWAAAIEFLVQLIKAAE